MMVEEHNYPSHKSNPAYVLRDKGSKHWWPFIGGVLDYPCSNFDSEVNEGFE
jgi:hypothetical protein